jgi:hypothetical protein
MRETNDPPVKRPFDTRIALSRHPGGLEIVIPPVRIGAPQVVAFLFLAILFAVSWTVGTHAGKSWFFALPFWAVAIVLTCSLLLSLVRTTRISVGPQTTLLEKSPFGYRRSLATAEIAVRVGRRASQDNDSSPGPRGLLLEYGTKTYFLMAGYSDQEQRWVADEIRNALSS